MGHIHIMFVIQNPSLSSRKKNIAAALCVLPNSTQTHQNAMETGEDKSVVNLLTLVSLVTLFVVVGKIGKGWMDGNEQSIDFTKEFETSKTVPTQVDQIATPIDQIANPIVNPIATPIVNAANPSGVNEVMITNGPRWHQMTACEKKSSICIIAVFAVIFVCVFVGGASTMFWGFSQT